MCLIIFAPHINRAKIRRAVLERAFLRNSDGAGMAYVKDGELTISKAYMDFDAFFKAYQRVRSTTHRGPLLIHFRWGTCGPNNETNTQPLNIYTGRLVMAHNGIFSGLSMKDSDVSDSVRLARLVRRAGWDYPFAKAQTEMLEALCDDSSKLVFIDNRGRHTIINERLGAWRAGAWYSNRFAFSSYSTPAGTWTKTDDPDLDVLLEHESKRYAYNDGPSEDWSPEDWSMDAPGQTRTPTVRQSSILRRPNLPEGVPYAQMTKLQKAAFEAHREQEAIRRKHQMTNGAFPWQTRTLISRDDDFYPRYDQS